MMIRIAAVAVLAFAAALPAQAQNIPDVENTDKDFEATYGVLPGFMKVYPKTAISGAWSLTKGLNYSPDKALEPKVKALINLAVAAQIPFQYCTWIETRLAKRHGASEEEIAEAVAQARLYPPLEHRTRVC